MENLIKMDDLGVPLFLETPNSLIQPPNQRLMWSALLSLMSPKNLQPKLLLMLLGTRPGFNWFFGCGNGEQGCCCCCCCWCWCCWCWCWWWWLWYLTAGFSVLHISYSQRSQEPPRGEQEEARGELHTTENFQEQKNRGLAWETKHRKVYHFGKACLENAAHVWGKIKLIERKTALFWWFFPGQ